MSSYSQRVTLSWVIRMQSITSHTLSPICILILSFNLHHCLPNNIIPYRHILTKILYAFPVPTRATCPAHLIGFFVTQVITKYLSFMTISILLWITSKPVDGPHPACARLTNQHARCHLAYVITASSIRNVKINLSQLSIDVNILLNYFSSLWFSLKILSDFCINYILLPNQEKSVQTKQWQITTGESALFLEQLIVTDVCLR
jgi:hypothetical protein